MTTLLPMHKTITGNAFHVVEFSFYHINISLMVYCSGFVWPRRKQTLFICCISDRVAAQLLFAVPKSIWQQYVSVGSSCLHVAFYLWD